MTISEREHSASQPARRPVSAPAEHEMDAQTVLRGVLTTIAEQHRPADRTHIAIKPITSGGANYTSTLFLATISADGKDDIKLFAKVATIGEKMREKMPADSLFRTERIVYTELMKTFERMQDDHNVPTENRLRFPKFYGCIEERLKETMVLEDLVAAGFGDHNRLKTVDWEYAAAAVTSLAKWHALSLVLEQEDPEQYRKYLNEMKFEVKQDEENMEAWKQLTAGALQVVQEKYKGKLLKFLSSLNHETYMKYYSPMRKAVLTHGDYRTSNLMHRIQNGALQIIPVDYQTVHSGCPASDLIYFIFNGTDQKFRKHHYQELIEHYFKQLTESLKLFDLDISKVYPREDFDADLQDTLPFGLIVATFILSIVTVEEANAPNLSGDAKIEDFAVAPNEVYAERMNGIVEDCVEWGIL